MTRTAPETWPVGKRIGHEFLLTGRHIGTRFSWHLGTAEFNAQIKGASGPVRAVQELYEALSRVHIICLIMYKMSTHFQHRTQNVRDFNILSTTRRVTLEQNDERKVKYILKTGTNYKNVRIIFFFSSTYKTSIQFQCILTQKEERKKNDTNCKMYILSSPPCQNICTYMQHLLLALTQIKKIKINTTLQPVTEQEE